MAGIENKKDDLEKQQEQKKEQETKDTLLNFWNWENENAKKLLNDPKWWEKSVKAIKDDIKEKSKEFNDPETKAKIEGLTKNIDGYAKLWKLNEEQAKELADMYKQINSVESTEHAEDAERWELAKESINKSKNDYAKNLLDATDKLDKFLKNNHEEAMNKVTQWFKKWQKAREQQQEPPSAYESLEVPPSQKESPKEKAPEAIA